MSAALYILLGLIAGILSGLIGVGGGTIIVPALVLFFGISLHTAQGTTVALLVPPKSEAYFKLLYIGSLYLPLFFYFIIIAFS